MDPLKWLRRNWWEKYVEMLHNIDPDMRGILVHALVGVSTPQTLKILGLH